LSTVLDTVKQLGPARIAIMGAVFMGLFLFFIFVSMRVSEPSLSVLYTGLDTTDSGAMAVKLEEAAIKYTVTPDGETIKVPKDEIGRARMLLAEAGLPNGGSLGYEIFDRKSSFGTTSLEQNIAQVRALEGELSRTIGSLESIKSARVHLVLPLRELFSRDTQPASASVYVSLQPNQQLSSGQIGAIRSLVASAVPQLKVSNITIIDKEGNLLARGGAEEDDLESSKSDEMRKGYENRLKTAVEEIVGRIVGQDKVQVTITADLNFDRISTNEESYDPATQVVRSTQTIQENNKERTPKSPDVTVDQNLPGAAAPNNLLLGDEPSQENNRVEEVTNYEISKTIKSMIREVGEVKKLSVAVLVDGIYTKDAEGKEAYTERTQAQLDQIKTLVQSAVGFDAARGDTIEVANMRFAELDTGGAAIVDDMMFGFAKSDILRIAEVLTVAIMVILVIMLVIQPMMGKLLSSGLPKLDDAPDNFDLLTANAPPPSLSAPRPSQDFEVPDDAESSINVQQVEGKVKTSSIKKVEDIVSSYPDETVSVIRTWMGQE